MQLTLGIHLDEGAWPEWPAPGRGRIVAGPEKFLRWLELWLGLQHPARDEEVLRIEKYRQALRLHLERFPDAFYGRSFGADAFATARDLLQRRDELLAADWNFEASSDTPPRLKALAEVEAYFQGPGLPLVRPGPADRLRAIRQRLPAELPLTQINHLEPLQLLPMPWQKLLRALESQGISLYQLPLPRPGMDTDLGRFQQALWPDAESPVHEGFTGDGSLVLLQGKRDADLAAFLAGVFRRNPDFRPLVLVPDGDDTLNYACMAEGLPSMGLPSTSLARPSLQVLKLITTFLWEPLDPFKLIQFVSLNEKPLEEGLSYRMARALAESPGIRSEAWRRHVRAYLEELRHERPDAYQKADRQYRFLFQRRRYPILGQAPRQEIIPLFAHLERWALATFDERENPHASLFVLAEQARRIRELLERLPEEELSPLQLERIVRTVYEPAPVGLFPRETGHPPVVGHPARLIGLSKQTLWWNFVQLDPVPGFDRWFPHERAFFDTCGLHLESPAEVLERRLYQQRQAIWRCGEQLLLVAPQSVRGEAVENHPLLADLQARFSGLENVTLSLEQLDRTHPLLPGLALTGRRTIAPRRLGQPPPFLKLSPEHTVDVGPQETFTSLEELFYYPHKWMFRNRLALRSSPILKIIDDNTLFGNLAHRLLDSLLRQEGVLSWPKEQVMGWIEREAQAMFRQEASVLLMYGREPERVQFILHTQRAALALLSALRTNGWEVEQTEMGLEGTFEDCAMRGRADLVLRRQDEWAVIDLKWGGYSYRRDTIRNREDIQLAFYAHLLQQGGRIPHTAYFIIQRAVLLARNREAFQQAETPLAGLDYAEVHRDLLQRMARTFAWRRDQLRQGDIELRCAATVQALHEAYGDQLLEMLEMREADARWDDYRTLMYLVE